MWFSANQIPATFRSGVALPVIGRSAVTWSKSWVTLDLRYISKFPSKIDTKFPQPTYYYDNNRPPSTRSPCVTLLSRRAQFGR